VKPVSVLIDKLYKNDLKGELCKVAIPFAKGSLPEGSLGALTLRDEAGNALPLQLLPTAKWTDGSIKYLLVRFAADIPGNSRKTLTLTEGSGSASVSSPVTLEQAGDGYTAGNGILSLRVKTGTKGIFEEVLFGDQRYAGSRFEGPVLTVNGTEYLPEVRSWSIAEEGPLLSILEAECIYPLPKPTRCTVRLTITAGTPYVDVAVRLFNDSMGDLIPDSFVFGIRRREDVPVSRVLSNSAAKKPDSTGCGDADSTGEEGSLVHTTGTGELEAIESRFRTEYPEGVRTATGISNYKTRFTVSGAGEPVSVSVCGADLVGEANEHMAEVFYGTFFADYNDENGGVCATVYQAQQNFPKAIAASEEGLAVHLIPQSEEKVLFSSGMAREQRILLHFHDADASLEALDDRSLIYQMPVGARIDPVVFAEAGVLPDVVTDPALARDDVEIALIAKADGHGRAYGMMNWGDFPDPNYTAQGRGGGKLVWTNNEYDYPHSMFLMYARTGVRRFLDYATVAANHWMDVDVCHYSEDPLRMGGQWEHTNGHTGSSSEGTGPAGVMVCSHEWVEGLLDHWHFSGDRRALETAVGIGENVLRLLDTPMYQTPGEANARETGWALRSLTALYLETGEDRWLVKSRFIIDQFKAWNERYGAWLSPYTDNTVIRVGFMISVAVGSLMRHYRVFPDEELKDMLLSAVEDLIENFRNDYGLFYYKELPSLQRNGNNTLLLESLAIAYELTGNSEYLKAGLRTFRNSIKDVPGYNSTKRQTEDTVLVGSGPTKNFAQSFLPLVQYYNALCRSGLI
jgi:hypothetical protein